MHLKSEPRREHYSPALNQSSLHRQFPLNGWLTPPSGFVAALADAIAWIAGAIALRVCVDWLISISMDFWLVGMLLLIAPALITAGLATVLPQFSLLLGYRLLLILVGLLIGGKR